MENLRSPLEQFDIYTIRPKLQMCEVCSGRILSVDGEFLWSGLIMFSNSILPIVILGVGISIMNGAGSTKLHGGAAVYIWDRFLKFIGNLVMQNRYTFKNVNATFPVFRFIIRLVRYMNRVGIVPFGFTISAQLSLTLALSSRVFIGINIIGRWRNGWKRFGLFLPSGVPVMIRPFLVVIEMVSYLARVLSLAVRLFANRIAGHALLKILASFRMSIIGQSQVWFKVLVIRPVRRVFRIVGLEMVIIFLQAYVFCVLSLRYLKDVLYVTAH